MQRLLLAPVLLLLAAPAAAQDVDWSQVPRVEIVLANFEFSPAEIHLKAGRPVVLLLRNASPNTHAFSSRAFFKAADVRPADRRMVAGGAIDLAGGEIREVAIVPRAGRYRVVCTQQYHETLGMTAAILVD